VGIAISGGTVTLDASSTITPTGTAVPGGEGSDGLPTSTTNGAPGGPCKTLEANGADGGLVCSNT
jgi:hypothetical protein